ncbi:MAG: TIGR04002 family protein [Ruminococcus sp.]|nr:TIGR04002 family protein [Ruminococcus sp.]
MGKNSRTKEMKMLIDLCTAGLMAAVIALFTAFVKFPTGINSGYLHVGDSMIYLAGCLIGPYGIIASAIGGALADIIAGSAVWAIPTAIIKVLNCVPFVIASHYYQKKNGKLKIINKYTAPMVLLSGIITIFGYLLAEGLMYTFPAALPSVPYSVVQAVGSAIIFIIAGLALDKANISKLIRK